MAKAKDDSGATNSLLAVALMQKEGLGGEEAKALLKDLLEEQLANRQKQREHSKRIAQNRVDAAKEMQQMRDNERSRCNHLKQDGTTRLSGQRLTGTGQICLVCKYCGQDFFHPPLKGQKAVPQGLWPTADEIGG